MVSSRSLSCARNATTPRPTSRLTSRKAFSPPLAGKDIKVAKNLKE